jgi:hypothetical protein
MPNTPAEDASEQIAARNVVNGLALRDALRGLTATPWDNVAVVPSVEVVDRPAVQACLDLLEDDVDAAADLLTAESVFQVMQGNTDRAAATLASGAGTGGLPVPGIVAPSNAGTAFTHRIAVVLGAPPPVAVWPAVGVRRLAEPRLDAWLGARLGSPAAIRCRALHGSTETMVDLAQLELSALDFVLLAQRTDVASELAARVEAHVRTTLGGLVEPITVDLTRPTGSGSGWPLTVFSVDEALETARLLGELVQGARPLASDDLAPPHTAGAPVSMDVAEMNGRVAAVLAHLAQARTALVAASVAASATPPSSTSVNDLRTALWMAAGLGVRAAVPMDLAGTDDAARTALLSQAATVQVELARRADAAGATSISVDQLRAVVGPEVPVLVPFVPANRADVDTALFEPPGNSLTTRHWLERMARVRDPLDRLRLAHLASDAMTGAELSGSGLRFEIAQLPFVPNARWIGSSFDPTDPSQVPRAGTVSIAVHRPAGHDTSGSWSGLLLDAWSEVIPAASQLTAFAVHHPSPGAEAPQCVLLAVAPPSPDVPTWSAAVVEDCIGQAFDVARMRAVDSDLLHPYSLLVPCIYLAANVAPDTVRSPLSQVVMAESVIAPPE